MNDLLREIEGFLAESRMSPSYFGKRACGNSEVVKRLRNGRPKRGGQACVNPHTAERIRNYIDGWREARVPQ